MISQFSSVSQSCPTLCDPMNCNMPGLPVHHQLQEFSQTHVHWVGDAIKPFCPLFPPYLHALNVSQHHGLFQWVCSLHHVANTGASASASVLSMNIQCWFLSGLISLIPLLSKGLPRFFSRTTDWKHQIFGAFSVFMVQLSHPYVTNGKTIVHLKLWTDFVSKEMSLLFDIRLGLP